MDVTEDIRKTRNLGLEAYFTKDRNPYDDKFADFQPRVVEIKNDQGEILESLQGAVFPRDWGQNSANTVASKYFKREGVPETKREIDIRQLAGRVAKTISEWGVEQGYFEEGFKKTLEHEIVAGTIGQYAVYNSPVWFNLGSHLYNIEQTNEGFLVDPKTGEASPVQNYSRHPQVSACFIVSPEDTITDMMEVGGVISSRIFKGGSGIGGSWRYVRSAGEPVSGGGVASGAVRFMDVQDSVARVIKSGGKTRRAATFQGLPIWHPDVIDLIIHKYKEEEKARLLIKAGSSPRWESHTIQDLRAQNVNISLSVDDKFWQAYENDGNYDLINVKDGSVRKTIRARDLAEIIGVSAHSCGDPGIQNFSTINRWNTCKNSGEIDASNPCSEYLFLNNSACNLASLNLLKFLKDGSFDIESFEKAIDLYITTQDILVSKASYPSKEIAENSFKFRPLGLGYANLGALIMQKGLAYDSEEARNLAGAITSLMTARAYLQSTRMAEKLGSFTEYEKNKDSMNEVIGMHQKAAKHLPKTNGLESIVNTALQRWEEVVTRGRTYGFRNAQVTLLAPTGTTGFMLGCDTTGCEPTFSLKAYKELAGGGSMIITNESVGASLKTLGYSPEQIEAIKSYIQKNETIEGSLLKNEHLPIFDCAVIAGKGKRFIEPMGHIKMLAALQPHLSGAISKSVNCPPETTSEEIFDLYYEAWRTGVKAVAIYRDGSKASQPLKTKGIADQKVLLRGQRLSLPAERQGLTVKVKISGMPLFLRTGEYEDGSLGEVFIDCMEQGSEMNRLLNENARQLSEKLQYGAPLDEALEFLRKAGDSRFSGPTDHKYIKQVQSLEGFIDLWLRANYLGDISFVQKDPEMRPLPWELRIYQKVPQLHLLPTVAGVKLYPDVPSLEETIMRISKTNFWQDESLDTRNTIEKIKKTRVWGRDLSAGGIKGKLTGRVCEKCGNPMIQTGVCWSCPSCKTGGTCG